MISGHATVQIAVEAIRLEFLRIIENLFLKKKLLITLIEHSNHRNFFSDIKNVFHSFDLIGKSL